MSKYQPLSEHLSASPGDEWLTSFAELERVLGFSLPKAARSGRSWWSNDPEKPHSRAWAAHGWEVGDVDHAAERVVFRKAASSGIALQTAAGLKPLGEGAEAKAPPAPESAPAAAASPAAAAQPTDSDRALAIPPAPAATKDAGDAAARQTLMFRAMRPAALVSAGVAVTATLGAFLLNRVVRRR